MAEESQSNKRSVGPGRKAIGNYEILGPIGQGGMGVIYRARDRSLGRIVALKVLREDLRSQSKLVARFRREAQAAALLNHPNIVQIYAVGTDDDIPYIAMEFIDGKPLSSVMQQEGPLHWDRALDIAEQVAQALACAHAAQVIHRDIKPPNILINADGQAYVTDFGIAKILTVEEQLTVDGTRLGTPQFMAPERCKHGEVTAESDIYSLGVLLFQMISGRLPYEASSSVELVRKILSEPPTRLRKYAPKVPERVELLVAYLIEKKPSDRPRSADEVCDAINLVRAGKPLNEALLSMTSALADFRQTDTDKPSWMREDPTTKLLVPKNPIGRFTQKWFGTPHYWLVIAAGLTVVFLASFFGYLLSIPLETDPAIAAARVLSTDMTRWQQPAPLGEFAREAPGVNIVNFALPDFTVGRLCATYSNIFVQFDGVEGSPRNGQRAIAAIRPGRSQAYLVTLPVPPVKVAGSIQPSTQLFAQMRYVAPDTDFSEHAVLRYTDPGSVGGYLMRAIVLCPPTPTMEPLPALFDAAASASGQAVSESLQALDIRPDGQALGLAIGSENAQSAYLAEATRGDGSWRQQVLSNFGEDPITFVQYLPAGNALLYLRDSADDGKQLWLVQTDDFDGKKITEGRIDIRPGAVSPDSQKVVFAVLSESEPARISIASLEASGTDADIGVGASPIWHPSGQFIVAIATDRRETHQMYRIGVDPPYARTQLTGLNDGVGGECVLTGDGNWAAAPLPGDAGFGLVLANTSDSR